MLCSILLLLLGLLYIIHCWQYWHLIEAYLASIYLMSCRLLCPSYWLGAGGKAQTVPGPYMTGYSASLLLAVLKHLKQPDLYVSDPAEVAHAVENVPADCKPLDVFAHTCELQEQTIMKVHGAEVYPYKGSLCSTMAMLWGTYS